MRRDGERISAALTLPSAEHTIAYSVPGLDREPGYEPFLVAAVPIAMRFADSLEVPAPVSPRLLAGIDRAQGLLEAWVPSLRRITVEADSGAPQEVPAPQGGTAAFFTGGVDSLYTALRHRESINALVYVRGFEFHVDSPRREEIVSERLRRGAADLGLPYIELESRLRGDFTEGRLDWGMYHGAALASAGLALGRFARILVPASQPRDGVLPFGSHPALDPLWSTETIAFEHDGEETRPTKFLYIADHQAALDVLHVCLQPGTDYNCGRCVKCANAALALELGGALQRCPTLPHRVPAVRIAFQRMHPVSAPSVRHAYRLAVERRRWALAAACRVRLTIGGRPAHPWRQGLASLRGIRDRLGGRLALAFARLRARVRLRSRLRERFGGRR